MKELHLLETNAGNIVVTTAKLDESNDSSMKIFEDAYISNFDMVTVVGHDLEKSLKQVKKMYEMHMRYWLRKELENTGVCLQ